MSISYFTRWINGAELFVNKPRCSQALYQCWRLWCTETFYGAKDTLWSASSHPINMYTDINAEMVISMKSTYSKKVIRDIETEQLFRLLVCQCPADTTRQCESVGSVREGSFLILRIHHKSKTSRMERLELLLPYIFFYLCNIMDLQTILVPFDMQLQNVPSMITHDWSVQPAVRRWTAVHSSLGVQQMQEREWASEEDEFSVSEEKNYFRI